MALDLTPSQTVGPFFSLGLCARPASELVDPEGADAVRIEGRVLDGDGEVVDDALVEIWQADRSGDYRPDFGWGRCRTDEAGHYKFVTLKPGRVADGAGGLQAPHLLVLVFARGLLKPVLTRLYFPDEAAANGEDRVLLGLPPAAIRETLVARREGDVLAFDIRLQGEPQTVFFAT